MSAESRQKKTAHIHLRIKLTGNISRTLRFVGRHTGKRHRLLVISLLVLGHVQFVRQFTAQPQCLGNFRIIELLNERVGEFLHSVIRSDTAKCRRLCQKLFWCKELFVFGKSFRYSTEKRARGQINQARRKTEPRKKRRVLSHGSENRAADLLM